ncbi:hypothetical protein BVRB_4g088220 [Beta vulgaris subsp. vulgaris]|nr:hypothetical protein BVRB_4g088220 [Beta vulgaris subsp. vulgaris]
MIKCINEEREALLQFKQEIQADHCGGKLSSWEGGDENRDCCQWHGILCNNFTGHVVAINLGGNSDYHCLEGKLSPSLLKLKHLEYLDLSFNIFQGQTIPTFIGSLANLKHLNLSNSGFIGNIPHELGNLSSLTSLDLSDNKVDVKRLGWLSHLTSLSVINLSSIDLSEVQDWFQVVNNLSVLKVLKMDWCNLPSTIPSSLTYTNASSTLHYLSLAHNNFGDPAIFQWLFNISKISKNVVHLDLSDNALPGSIPSGLKDMHFLSYLDLSSNAFEGLIPLYFGNMHSLSHLDLSANVLEGPISSSFWNMQSLSYLDVSGNTLEGHIPDTISNFKHAVHLDLSWNNFQGTVPNTLGELCGLQFLELSYNNLTGDLSNVIKSLSVCSHKSLRFLNLETNHFSGSVPDTIELFSSLRVLYLDANQLNGTISQGIAKLSMLETLRLSSNSLKGSISDNHLANFSRLRNLDLSDNPRLVVNISADWVPPFQLDSIYLSLCKLGPYFPKWLQTQNRITWVDISIAGISDIIPVSFWNSLSSKIEHLNMSHNNIHGMLPSNLSITFRELPQIDLSSNSMEGAIPSFLGNISSLSLNDNLFSDPNPFLCPQTKMGLSNLDLSNNLFSGELPDCWMYFDELSILRLENNKFLGNLPTSIGALKKLQALHLRNNSFSGELPTSLQNCTSLVLLDVSYNSLTGYIPSMIGDNLKRLGILSLRSNHFFGVLPLSLCQLSHLQIMDLSFNHISGNIPRCIHNLKAMTSTSDLLPEILYQYDFSVIMRYYDAAFVMWKGKDQIFRNSLGQVKFIHMSNNALEGDIPEGITNLVGLVSLDLSDNKLNGSITPKIGMLKSLELLDLSSNHLSGEIPATLANLNFLGMLNLSYNNLSGKIPTGTLLQGFDTSAYFGNPKLCGAPLAICAKDRPRNDTSSGDDIVTHQENDGDENFPGLYISVVLGFIVGFWGVCGSLVIKRSWRYAFLRTLDNVKDTVCG